MRKQPCGVNFLPKLDNLLSFLQLLYSFLNANTILLSYCKLRCTKVSYRPLRLQYSNSDMWLSEGLNFDLNFDYCCGRFNSIQKVADAYTK